MKDPRDIIKRPVITERSRDIMAEKKYTFDVDVKSNKTEVKDAIEEIFGVKVEKVNIMNYKGEIQNAYGRTQLVLLTVVVKRSLN